MYFNLKSFETSTNLQFRKKKQTKIKYMYSVKKKRLPIELVTNHVNTMKEHTKINYEERFFCEL